jgi:hypothetical protein
MGSVALGSDTVVIRKWARGETRIYLDQISAVSIEPAGIGLKAIRFVTAGGVPSGRPLPVMGSPGIGDDPQALMFTSGQRGEFAAFADLVNAARMRR